MNVTVAIRRPGKPFGAHGEVLEVLVEGAKSLERDTIRNAVEGVVALHLSQTPGELELNDAGTERLIYLEQWAGTGEDGEDPRLLHGDLEAFYAGMRAVLRMGEHEMFGDGPELEAVVARVDAKLEELRGHIDQARAERDEARGAYDALNTAEPGGYNPTVPGSDA